VKQKNKKNKNTKTMRKNKTSNRKSKKEVKLNVAGASPLTAKKRNNHTNNKSIPVIFLDKLW